jgi:hypothetical protein
MFSGKTFHLALPGNSYRIFIEGIRHRSPSTKSVNNNVKGALADGMYDSNKNFRYLSKNHIKATTNTAFYDGCYAFRNGNDGTWNDGYGPGMY